MSVAGVAAVLGQAAVLSLALALALSFLVFGLTAAWLADEKGRNGTTWLLLGTLLGPVGLFGIGVAPRGASGRFGPCWACREPIDREAVVCPFCQTDLTKDSG